jgi:hypothetical protein
MAEALDAKRQPPYRGRSRPSRTFSFSIATIASLPVGETRNGSCAKDTSVFTQHWIAARRISCRVPKALSLTPVALVNSLIDALAKPSWTRRPGPSAGQPIDPGHRRVFGAVRRSDGPWSHMPWARTLLFNVTFNERQPDRPHRIPVDRSVPAGWAIPTRRVNIQRGVVPNVEKLFAIWPACVRCDVRVRCERARNSESEAGE